MGGNIMFGIFGINGLIKANIRVYLKARSRGKSHEESLDHVLKTRYPFSKKNQKYVKDVYLAAYLPLFNPFYDKFKTKEKLADLVGLEFVDLIELLHAICFFETREKEVLGGDFTAKIVEYIEKLAK